MQNQHEIIINLTKNECDMISKHHDIPNRMTIKINQSNQQIAETNNNQSASIGDISLSHTQTQNNMDAEMINEPENNQTFEPLNDQIDNYAHQST